MSEEQDRARSAAWYAANREKTLARSAAWYAANTERKRATTAAWYVANREEIAAKRAAVSENKRAYDAAYQAAPASREKRRPAHARRHAEKYGAEINDLTVEQWSAVLAYYDHKCAYCGVETYGLDHVVALANGGNNTVSNVVPACRPCNASKGRARVEDFMRGRAT